MIPSILGSDTIASVFKAWAAAKGDDVWLAFEPKPGTVVETSWGTALERACSAAALLSSHGVAAGDRFHLHLTNCPEFYDFWLAAALTGSVMVPTNPALTAEEIAYVTGHARTRLSITEADLAPTVVDAVELSRAPVLIAGDSIGSDAPAPFPDHIARPLDPVGILYTSGTTSKPKGVLVTNAAYLYSGHVVAEHLRLRPDDRQLIVLPLFHGNAQYYSTMSALVTGASVALAPRFSASRWSEQARGMNATVASLFAAPIRMLLAAPPSPSDHAHRLRVALFAQNVTPGELESFEARFACPLAQLYGMTETVAPPIMNPVFGETRNHTMGRPVLGTRIRIVDGELQVAGEPGVTMMTGYLDNPEATAVTLVDGWLRTGDQVEVDDDGYLIFTDRAKDVIKRAGENISSTEIEAVINTHPAVFEAAVVGVPDPMYDEIVVAVVVLKSDVATTEEEVIEHCRKRLAKFKVPVRVEFVSELPRTPVGKVQKHLIKGRLGS